MLSLVMKRGKPGVHALDLPKPEITQPEEVLIRVKEAGIDGTDFNMVKFNLQDPAKDRNEIVMGHEMVGVVEKVGAAVTTVAPGDTVVTTVRRGCGICEPCLTNQSDMCLTGFYTERGIHKADGYFTLYIVEKEDYMVKVPPELIQMAVFVESLSIVEKGIEQIRIIQSRLPWACDHPGHHFASDDWGGCKTGMVIGAGPLGIMATSLLRLAGVMTTVIDIVPDNHLKAQIVNHLGANYVNATGRTTAEIVTYCCGINGRFDVVFEASGVSSTALDMFNYMSPSSIFVMTGIPRTEMVGQVDIAQFLRQIVRNNQVVVGSVNSNRSHFNLAVRDMGRIKEHFGDIVAKMITHRYKLTEHEKMFAPRDETHIKSVINIAE